MNLGPVLKAYRESRQLDQATLAEKIGIGASMLCRIEKGNAPAAPTLVKILCWLTGVK